MGKKNNNIDKKNNLTIDKCIMQVDMVDYYITKNILKIISNKKNYEFILNNIFILSINNGNNKNSLIILLENGKYEIISKLIEHNYEILNYKNILENNLFKSLLAYDYFYDLILNKIKNLDRKYIIHIITCENARGHNFIDNLVILIDSNTKYFFSCSNELNINGNKTISNKMNSDKTNNKILLTKLMKLIEIAHNIYLLDAEKYTYIITKLSKDINDENFLLDIFKKFNINNFDVYPDNNLLTCIDYLILNEYYSTLIYFLDKINYIEFTNIDDNLVFKLCEDSNVDIDTKTKIIIQILHKSNIAKFKNNKNQNIFYWLIKNYDININTILKFNSYIDIYEQDINGTSLYDLIINKYGLNKVKKNLNKFKTNYIDNKTYLKICEKINMKNKLIKSDIGIFSSNIIHNMLYTIYILNSHSQIIKIPYCTLSNNDIAKSNKLLDISNNEKNLIGYIKLFFSNFNKWFPHLITWKNKYNYWIDPNLIDSVSKIKSTRFVYIKLSIYLSDIAMARHSNVIIIDNDLKIVERFEPYGEMIFANSVDINDMILRQIANPLGYKFEFVQPYPGFQSRSDEFAKFNKSYGDPMGFCLAWSFLYIDIKMELIKNKIEISPINFINWYVINKFNEDFEIDVNINRTNKYILFIRFYSRYLDTNKNIIIKNFGLDPSLSYQNDLDSSYQTKLIECINNELDL